MKELMSAKTTPRSSAASTPSAERSCRSALIPNCETARHSPCSGARPSGRFGIGRTLGDAYTQRGKAATKGARTAMSACSFLDACFARTRLSALLENLPQTQRSWETAQQGCSLLKRPDGHAPSPVLRSIPDFLTVFIPSFRARRYSNA